VSQAAPPRPRQELPVDPRFRRRWAEARRAEGRRRLRILLGALVVVTVVAGGFGLVHSPVFRVRTVIVVGSAHTPSAEIAAAAGLEGGHGVTLMVGTGSAAARRAVEALPWVRTVSFRRDWPWTLVVTVKERVPVALVEAGVPAGGTSPPRRAAPSARGGPVWDMVDGTGRVLEVSSGREPSHALAVVVGARTAQPGTRVLPVSGLTGTEVGELLEAAGASSLALDERGLRLAYSPGQGLVAHVGIGNALVVLGDPADMGEKLAVLEELVNRVGLGGYSEVDLTVPDRPALTPVANSSNS